MNYHNLCLPKTNLSMFIRLSIIGSLQIIHADISMVTKQIPLRFNTPIDSH